VTTPKRVAFIACSSLLGASALAALRVEPASARGAIEQQDLAYGASVCRPTPTVPRKVAASLQDVGSIGIAYFAGRSRDGDDAHLAAALTTELANQLLSARPLEAVDKKGDPPRLLVVKLSEGGGFADVDLSMTGSVFRDETGVRTTVKLTRTSDGSVVWAGTIFRPLLELPILARVIAQQVAVRIGARLTAQPPRRVHEKSAEVYELLLRGMYIPSRYDPEELVEAIDYFNQALKLDPTSTNARQLRDVAQLRLVAWGGTGSTVERQLLAGGALKRILDRDRDESERLVEEADSEMRDGVPVHACQLLNAAIDRDARSAPAYALRSLIKARGGEVREAFSDAEVVTQLGRPIWGNSLRAVALRRTGDTTSARRQTRALLADARRRTGPLPFWDARFIATALAELNDWTAVQSVLRRIDPRDPRLAWLRRDPTLQPPSSAERTARRSR
jgi:TolB-like protein